MKILIDGRLYGLENAGLGRYVMNLVTELAELDKKNSYSILLTKKYFNELSLPKNWKKILADFRHYSFKEQISLSKIINKENPDITHFPHFNVPINFKGKFIVTIHDLLMHKNVGLTATTLPAPAYFIKRMAYKTVFKKAVIDSFKIIVPSNAVKKEITYYYKVDERKIEVVYEGVDGKFGDVSTISENKIGYPYFVYAGNAYPHKNLARLISALIELNKKSNQKIILAIASARNIFTQRLQKIIKEFKAENYVKLLGFVPDADLPSLYLNSIGFVFPSLSEGFGLPGLEAMSAGTLVLASDIPVFREIYKDNALYFNPLEIDSITNAMQTAIKITQSEREKLTNKGKEFAKRYSWAKMAQETLKLYEGSDSVRQGK